MITLKKSMIQKIYTTLGKSEFISLTKYLTNEQKNEVFLKILEEDAMQIHCL